MYDDFKWQLLERHPTLDLEEDASLFEGLFMKYKKTIQKQDTQATVEIAAQDVGKYLDSKAVFLRELSSYGLDMDNTTDHQWALELWDERGTSIVVDNQDVYFAATEVQRDVRHYLLGKASASPTADATILAPRFNQEDLEALVTSNQKQRDFIKAFSEFLSKALPLDGGVLKFRRDVLGDSQNTISHKEADELVRSPAAQLLSKDLFVKAGIPVVGHTAKLDDGSDLLYAEPPGETVTSGRGEPQRKFRFRWFTVEDRLESPLSTFT